MDRKCDVIVPVKNAVNWVDWCLAELFRHTPAAELGAVLVIDDGSTAAQFAELERICARHPVRLLRNEGRPGFGGACTFAMARTSAPYALLLNTDCLVTPGTIRKLVAACESDKSIGLACPLSNNSPVLTLPMLPGRSYLEMNRLLEEASAGARVALDACTVVGNCLLLTRACWEAAGGFDPSWGAGYGEETDLQFRAMDRGFRGVAVIDSYVFHFGSASFRYQFDMKELKEKNYQLFLERWGEKYRAHARRCALDDPLEQAAARLRAFLDSGDAPPLQPAVLFVLPGIDQGIGGIHVVIDLCNHFIRSGLEARAAILGRLDASRYQEPILFGLLHFPDEGSLAEADLAPGCVVSTLFSTAGPAYALARQRGVPLLGFVQGYEVYFENGIHRREVESSYAIADELVTTSRWLEESIRRTDGPKRITRLPLGVNEHLFFPDAAARGGKVRVGVVLRNSPDKGQWVLLEVLHRLKALRGRLAFTILAADLGNVPAELLDDPDTVTGLLPLDRGALAARLQPCDMALDASLHEGFGLMPLEAMACGAAVVCSDSGGIGDFVRHEVNGLVVPEVNKPGRFAAAVERLVEDRALLRRLQGGALRTAGEFLQDRCFDAYLAFFQERLARAAEVEKEVAPPAPGPGLAAMDTRSLKPGPVVLRATGTDPYLLLPGFKSNGAALVLRVDIESPLDTVLQIFFAQGRRLLARLRPGANPAAGFSEQRSVRRPLRRGKNRVYLEVPGGGRLRLDPATLPGDFTLEGIEARAVEPGGALETAFEESSRSLLKLCQETGYAGLEPLHQVTVLPTLELPEVAWKDAPAHLVSIEIESSRASTLGLYWQTQASPGFSNARSMRRPVRKGRDRIACVLREARLAGGLRVNPGNAEGEYRLQSLEIRPLQ